MTFLDTTSPEPFPPNTPHPNNPRNPDSHRENHADRHGPGAPDELNAPLNANARIAIDNNGTLVGTRRAINLIPGTDISLTTNDNSGSERVDVTINATTALSDLPLINTQPASDETVPANYTGIVVDEPYCIPAGHTLSIGAGATLAAEGPQLRSGLGWTGRFGNNEYLPGGASVVLPYGPYEIPAGSTLAIGPGATMAVGEPTTPLGPLPVRDMIGYGAPTGSASPGDRYYDRTNNVLYIGLSTGLWTPYSPTVPHTNAVRNPMANTNSFSNQTSYGTFPNATDKAALTITTTKARADTNIVVRMSGSCQFTSGVAQYFFLGIQQGGNNYDVCQMPVLTATAYPVFSGLTVVTGLAAGSYTWTPIFKTQGASVVSFLSGAPNSDFVAYEITESL